MTDQTASQPVSAGGPRFTEDKVRAALMSRGSVTGAAAELGVSRKTVHDYIRRYQIHVRRGVLATT